MPISMPMSIPILMSMTMRTTIMLTPRHRKVMHVESMSSKIINSDETAREGDIHSRIDSCSNEVRFTESFCRKIEEYHNKHQLVLDIE